MSQKSFPRLRAFRSVIFFLFPWILPAFFSSALASDIPKPLQSLHDDALLPAACSSEELGKLKSEIDKLPKIHQPAEAWELIRTMLCGVGEKADDYIQQHRAKRLYYGSFETGEEKAVRKRWKSGSPLVQKQAWSPHATGGGDKIEVSYWKDEACIAGFEILFKNAKWLLTSLHQACD
ncbi:MAG: hypothetical protein U1F57_09520 [bacterium]